LEFNDDFGTEIPTFNEIDRDTSANYTIDVDSQCDLRGKGSVYGTYSCMLNHITIATNSNKFYCIQIIECGGKYYNYTRWGRVGEKGHTALRPATSLTEAITSFCKKFREKTQNEWGAPFIAKPGKYSLINYSNENSGIPPLDGNIEESPITQTPLSQTLKVNVVSRLNEPERIVSPKTPQVLQQLKERINTVKAITMNTGWFILMVLILFNLTSSFRNYKRTRLDKGK